MVANEEAEKMQWVRLDDLSPWARNARQHSDDSTGKLAAGIRRFGFLVPLTAWRDESRIAAGHGRRLAMLSILREDPAFVPRNAPPGVGPGMVPVMWEDFASEAQFEAFAIADNRQAKNATDDDGALALILHEMDMQGLGFEGMGFGDDEIADMLAGLEGDGETEPDASDDDVPEVDEGEPDSRVGEVYELGPHRLICGDCRDSPTVARLLDGQRITIAFTSPPYASQRKYDESSGFTPIPPDEYVDWFSGVQAAVRENLADDGSWFVNIKEHSEGGAKHLYVKDLATSHVREWGWRLVDEYCWLRQAIPGDPNSMKRFKNAWEPVFHFAAAGLKFRPDDVRHESARSFSYADQARAGRDISARTQGRGDNAQTPVGLGAGLAYPSNVINIKGGANVVGHSAAFPVALPSFFIRAFSDTGDAIYDPFMGSGTTIIAAASTGRVAHGSEISPRYCDVIRRRWTRWAREHDRDPGPGALEPVTG
jgi:DNA modification methylase